MKNLINFLIMALLCPLLSFSQYVETFDLSNKGILSGGCSTNDPTSCNSFDFSGVTWTITGDLSGIDSEGFSTTSGYLLAEDLDEEACWQSPPLNISGAGTSSITVNFTIPAGATWENSTTPGSIDFMDVNYSIDGGSFITAPNQNGCPGSGHTISGSSCSSIVGPQSYAITVSGLVGTSLIVQVCIDTNASSDDGHLEEVSVIGGVILPVVWGEVQAVLEEGRPIISWSTYHEINTDYFEIQRYDSALDEFINIGEVNALGYSIEKQNYSFNDAFLPNDQVVYYRVKQSDLDGRFSYSKEVVIKQDLQEREAIINVFPNPVTDNLYVEMNEKQINGYPTIKIVNSIGQVVLEKVLEGYDPNDRVEINTSTLESGIYFVNFFNQSHQQALVSKVLVVSRK